MTQNQANDSHRLPGRLGLGPRAAILFLFATTAGADQLVTEDGRILECKKAREHSDGYQLEFEHGTFVCPRELIASVAIEGDMSDYVPANDDERKKLEQGYVRYRGRWMSKPAYESELSRLNEERRKRTEELALHADFINAYEKETRHFVIKTNTSPELLDHYADLLDTYYKLMDDRVGIKPTPTLKRTKMTVNIYKNHREFLDLSAAEVGPSTLGYFWSFDNTLNFFHDYQEPSRSEWVALHECTHLLTYLIDPQFGPQIWINEAVADYFGSADITRDDRGKLIITPGKLQTDRVLTVQQAIKDGNDTKLEKLFKIGRGDFTGFQYAHAWSFVYFLNESNKKYARGFASFFKDLYTRKGVKDEAEYGGRTGTVFVVPPDEIRRLLLKKIGVKDTDQLEKEWKEFIAAIPVDAPEARFKRAYRQIMYGIGDDNEQAMEDLDFAIEAGIDDARAYWARGRLRSVSGGGLGAGVEDFRKAVEMDPLNPAYRYDLGQALAGRPFNLVIGGVKFVSNMGLKGSDEEIEEALMQFGLAKELSPENDLYRTTYDEFMRLYQEWKSENG